MRSLTLMALVAILSATSPKTVGQDGAATPCACCSEAYRQFDFWLGDWEAFAPNGNLAGTNHIVLLQDSCVIQENWSSGGGAFTGTSYNFYDSATGRWHQTWVDNQGGSLLLNGAWDGNAMILSSEHVQGEDGSVTINKITWTPNEDGSVRQFWEVTTDGGTTWNAAFDGLYKPKTR